MKKYLFALLLSLGGTTMSASSNLFEFNAGKASWFVVNDGVMGGVSNSRVQVVDGLLEFSGRVRLENNGGFASVRSSSLSLDLSQSSSLKIRVRGDGKRYSFQLGTSSARGVLYQTEFGTTAGQWLELSFPLAAFKPTRFGRLLGGPALDKANLEQFGFIVGNKRAEDFQLEVDWIRAF
jgi:NADH dehydrogenase [ubiquinone] 1 alpha subcomplex assembly factor 1